MLSELETWEIDTDFHYEVGFNHQKYKWNLAYLYMDKWDLLATGKGKLYKTCSTTVARAYTMFPQKICRVARRYLELTGTRPMFFFECIEWNASCFPGRRFHVIAPYVDAMAMQLAFEEEWDKSEPVALSID